jgi:hypothetical protein
MRPQLLELGVAPSGDDRARSLRCTSRRAPAAELVLGLSNAEQDASRIVGLLSFVPYEQREGLARRTQGTGCITGLQVFDGRRIQLAGASDRTFA